MLAVGGCVDALFGRLIDKKQRRCIPLLFEIDSLTSPTRDSGREAERSCRLESILSLRRLAFRRHFQALNRLAFVLRIDLYRIAHLLLPLSFSTSLVLLQAMTDRSNYGPVRRLSPPVSADYRKPYSRTGLKGVLGTLDLNSGDTAVPTPSDSPYYPFHVETPQLEAPTQNRNSVPDDGPRGIAGFPTYEQYKRIEDEYLSSLSERKQPKALISQVLFDKVFAVLQNGSEDRGSTAQFRFWVRKMFVLAYPQTSFNHNAGQTPELEPVVLHDKRPVAIKEQIYEVLCYCHAVARHGGRDKTCATLRLHYSWVPKELTAKFVKACPTCTLKRSGNPDLLSQFGRTVSSSPYAAAAPTVTVPPVEPASLPVFLGGPNDSPPPGLSFVVGSEGCDDVGSGGYTGFGHSIFATPDLSVYPSPTLSAGSLGPTTPSPYLPSGFFGYPAMFDPGHGSLSSVAGWDPSSLSPCGPVYVEELHSGISKQQEAPVGAEEIIDSCAQGMQLQLPISKALHPLCMRAHSSDFGNGGGDEDGLRCNADSLPRIRGASCPVGMCNIDPVLLMEGGYPPFALVGSTRMTAEDDAEVDMDTGAGGPGCDGSDAPYFQVLNLAAAPNASGESPSPSPNNGTHVLLQQHQQPLPQLGLVLSTTTPDMGSDVNHRMQEPASTPGPRRRPQLLSPEAEETMTTTMADACSFSRDIPDSLLSFPPPSAGSTSVPEPLTLSIQRGAEDNPLIDMIVFKFAPPPGATPIAAPTPTAMPAIAPGIGSMEEVRSHSMILLPSGCHTQVCDEWDAQEQDRLEEGKSFETETRMSVEEVGRHRHHHRGGDRMEDAAAGRWDSPEAWLVQSDSTQWCE